MTGRARLGLILATVSVAAITASFLGFRQAAGDEPPAPHVSGRLPSPTPSKRAAVITATELLSSLDLPVLLDDRRRRRVIDRYAARSSRHALQRLYAAEKQRVSDSYRRPPRFARAALAGYRVDEFTPSASTVSIWAATIGGSGSYPPTAGWSTTTVTLTWDRSRWRVSDVRDEPGPAPDWPIETLSSEARGFKEYRHAP
jgi:hypothetical protein